MRCREDFYRERHPLPDDVLLVVEVAVSSLRFDRNTKAPLYARHGVPELWIVDVEGRRLIRHRSPQQGAYALVDDPDLSVALEVSGLPGVAFHLSSLFR